MTGLGTLLRHVHELMDGAIAEIYADRGMPEFRPRFSPYVRTLVSEGPMAIRDLAKAIGVTHSAASQTVVQMRRCDLVTLEKGADARHRIVHLTAKARAALPLIEAEWAATEQAVRELDAELPVPLAEVLRATVEALERRPFRTRIEACDTLDSSA
ncbi:MarR family winged helix-turn-helix transcriptional regulator [Nonomuraea basaltis]|uniref:MarR family winged helix-turn-helix transcriptional regulator n=1 Tax=Nonomuraea basaltis TaxID=2495887 RepID=UPI00110C67F2|nr:winged helix DNA-binding protein [Nonomuraea basaltis]TMR89781.1 winged helix DNA-binding protein [Nonomuraea basaltis]